MSATLLNDVDNNYHEDGLASAVATHLPNMALKIIQIGTLHVNAKALLNEGFMLKTYTGSPESQFIQIPY